MKLFIGYFRSDLDLKKAASFINKLCPKIKHFEYKSKKIGLNGSASFLFATFENKKEANNAIAILKNKAFRGHPLIARIYEDRSAANERRNTLWRSQQWNNQERRRGERRQYKKLEIDRNPDNPSFLSPETTPRGISVQSFSSDEARAFLKMSIKKPGASKKSKGGENNPANNPFWKKQHYI
jgi:hypothetical protein